MSTSGRGGYREGAGRPSAWNNSRTVAIRVPKCFSKQIIKYARLLDNNEIPKVSNPLHNQKILHLLNVALDVPIENFDKDEKIIREVISILKTLQN